MYIRSTNYAAIQNCSFHGNTATRNGGGIYLNRIISQHVEHCTFHLNTAARSGGGMYVVRIITLHVEHCTFHLNTAGKSGGGMFLYKNTNMLIKHCTFKNNLATFGSGAHITKAGYAQFIYNTFKNNSAVNIAGALYIIDANCRISQCMFKSNKGKDAGGISIYAENMKENMKVDISLSRFDGNKAYRGGAIRAISDTRDTAFNISIKVSRCLFTRNIATFGGAIYINRMVDRISFLHGIEYSQFLNNTATVLGQSVFNKQPLNIYNIFVEAQEGISAYHIYSEVSLVNIRKVDIKLHRSNEYAKQTGRSMGLLFLSSGSINSSYVNLTCPVGFNANATNSSFNYYQRAKLLKQVYTYLTLDCAPCSYGTYNLLRGTLYLDTLSSDVPLSIHNHKCNACVSGSICDVYVKSLDNYWGYRKNFEELSFFICPTGYCCSADTTPCLTYNTCSRGRTGTLCGTCSAGYKQSFLTKNCIPQGEECNFNLFIVYLLMFSVLYTSVFVIITNIKDLIYWIKKCFKSSKKAVDVEGVIVVSRDIHEKDIQPDKLPYAGYVQIVILYFQVSSMLKVNFQGGQKKNEGSSSVDGVREIISDIFNFRFTIYQGICPSDDLTLPMKELILFGMKISSLCELTVLLIVYQLIKVVCRKRRTQLLQQPIPIERSVSTPLTILSPDHDDNDSHLESPLESHCVKETVSSSLEVCFDRKMDFGHRLKRTFIKLLKLFYTPITMAALKMTHCVKVGRESHLFVYGDHICYSIWQIGIIVTILPGIMLFPIGFELALRLLEKQMISSGQFVAASACPYYAIVLYLRNIAFANTDVNDRGASPEEEAFTSSVLEAETDLFVTNDGSFFGWQIIQLYRTLAMNFISIFITNPFYRSITFAPVLIGFTFHDVFRQPYKNSYLNKLQYSSTTCLLLVLSCNVVSSVSFMVDVTTIPLIFLVVNILSIIEMMLYAMVPLSLPVWTMYSYISNKRNAIKKNQ